MATSRTGYFRYALLRLLGFAATIAAASLLLALALSGNAGFDAAALPQALERLAVTLPLALLALLFSTLTGVPAGYLAATAAMPGFGRALMAAARLLMAVPAFWLGMALVLLLAGVFRLAPPGGFVPWQQNPFGALASLMLPAVALALPLAAVLARRVRRDVEDIVASPTHFAVRTTGSTGREATRALSRAIVPALLERLGRQLGPVLAGAMIVENVFYLPGLGRLLFESVAAHDLPVAAAALMVLIAVAALGRLGGDLGRHALDPRLLEPGT
jgi:peptide/nickel transport system permease protein